MDTFGSAQIRKTPLTFWGAGFRDSLGQPWICFWWSGGGSNSRPSHCERDALPAELPPHDQTILARRKITVPDQTPGSLRSSRRPSQHPIHDGPNISIIHRRMRGHGNRAPNAGTTILHFPSKQSPSPSIPLVPLRHLLKRRPDKLPINRMASHTSISPSDGRPTRRRIGSMRGV